MFKGNIVDVEIGDTIEWVSTDWKGVVYVTSTQKITPHSIQHESPQIPTESHKYPPVSLKLPDNSDKNDTHCKKSTV